ncbi:tail fiber assembly protein [Achromobacter deleyi]|uniref:tail fiber assembly protein n=1 Tax=Achromobacter deleyi TaxID=1353891 RepID=UPI0015815657|nr:tail fiber assembly protein [Achromobacter deleyi]
MMRTYALIIDGAVAELLSTEGDIKKMFHPDLLWVDITDVEPTPAVGWLHMDGTFHLPQKPPPSEAEVLAEIDSRLGNALLRVFPLMFMVESGEASPEEVMLLKRWKRYTVDVSRIASDPAFPARVKWPEVPV